jgi:DNA/RNA endonuclease G (NUC1)
MMTTRLATLAVLLLTIATIASAEYCQSQGSPRIPKGQIEPFNRAAFLTAAEIMASEARHLPWGRPQCRRILFHREYVLCYDDERKVALWASYRLESADVVEAERVNGFRTDPRLPEDQNAACDDYRGSGFDRGHMVPRSDMNRSLVAMVNTFFLTNMTPQRPNVNQGAWERLERLGRIWATKFGRVHILSGSVWDADDDLRPDAPADAELSNGDSGVPVPTHYFKIVLRPTATGGVEGISFVIPNATNVPGRNSSDITRDNFLRGRIRRIHEIRQRTGLDLMPDMDAIEKAALEQALAPALWLKD